MLKQRCLWPAKEKQRAFQRIFFIFNFIVPLKIQGKRCKTVIMFYFLSWKSKKMNRSLNHCEGGEEKQNDLALDYCCEIYDFIIKYKYPMLVVSLLHLFFFVFLISIIFQKALLSLSNLELNRLFIHYFPQDDQACWTGN